MRRLSILAFLAFCLASSLAADEALAPPSTARCFVVMAEGASPEGNSLYLRKMGVEPSLLRLFAPTRFRVSPAGVVTSAEGQFSYEAESPQLVVRSRGLAVYALSLRYRAERMPAAKATLVVDFKLSELAAGAGLVQPAEKAIELAAAKARMRSGLAWIVSMEMPTQSSFRARVQLAP
jgi:hypothetical protein